MTIIMTSETIGVTATLYMQMLTSVEATLKQAPGFILHTAHPIDGGFRVIEIWHSREDSDRFFATQVAPILPDGIRPKRHTHPLHSLLMAAETELTLTGFHAI